MLNLVHQNDFDNPVREYWQTCDKSGLPTVWSADPVTKMPSEAFMLMLRMAAGWAQNWLIKNSISNEFAINLMSPVNAWPMAKFLVRFGSLGNDNCFKLLLFSQEYKEIFLLFMARRMFCLAKRQSWYSVLSIKMILTTQWENPDRRATSQGYLQFDLLTQSQRCQVRFLCRCSEWLRGELGIDELKMAYFSVS